QRGPAEAARRQSTGRGRRRAPARRLWQQRRLSNATTAGSGPMPRRPNIASLVSGLALLALGILLVQNAEREQRKTADERCDVRSAGHWAAPSCGGVRQASLLP